MNRNIYPVQLMIRRGKNVSTSKKSISDAKGFLRYYLAHPNGMYFEVSDIIGTRTVNGTNPDFIACLPVYRLTILQSTMNEIINGSFDTGIAKYKSFLWDGANPMPDFNIYFSGTVKVYDHYINGIKSRHFRNGNTFSNYDITKEPSSGYGSISMNNMIIYQNFIIRNDLSIRDIFSYLSPGPNYEFIFQYDEDTGIVSATDYMKSIYKSGDVLIQMIPYANSLK